MRPFKDILAFELSVMLTRPQVRGAYLGLATRSELYLRLPPDLQVMVYDMVRPALYRQCGSALPPIDFDKAFPAPAGLEQYRARQRRRLAPQGGG